MNHSTTLKEVTSCGAVIYKYFDGELHILLIKARENVDRWGIPKGHKDPGETDEECATREVFEEVGLVIKLEQRLEPVRNVPSATRDNKKESKTIVAFTATPVGGELSLQEEEVHDADWFPAKDLPKIHFHQIPLVTSALRLLTHR